jgi:hypothetical protein
MGLQVSLALQLQAPHHALRGEAGWIQTLVSQVVPALLHLPGSPPASHHPAPPGLRGKHLLVPSLLLLVLVLLLLLLAAYWLLLVLDLRPGQALVLVLAL